MQNLNQWIETKPYDAYIPRPSKDITYVHEIKVLK